MTKSFPEWASMMLKLAGITNAFWGLTFTLFPDILFRWAAMSDPQYLFPWKMIGAIAIIFGVFYFIAAFNPPRHTMFISIGLIIKLTEFIFIMVYWLRDEFPLKLTLYFFAKDLLWLFPLAIILYLIYEIRQTPQKEFPNLPLQQVLPGMTTISGKNLKELTDTSPVMLIFLRHFGCTFCHQTLQDIRSKRSAIEEQGVRIVLVHMASPEEALQYFKSYALQDIEHISDPDCTIYTIFHLKKAHIRQMLGIKAWKPLPDLETFKKFSLYKSSGDRLRMPGVFLLYQDEMLKSYKHAHISERPNYVALASRTSFSA